MRIKSENESTRLILSFIITSGILTVVYACTLVYPFGNGSVLALDLNGQYVSYFEAYRRAMTGEGSLLYSWSRNLSGEFYGLFCYYLASPLNLIVLLFPEEYITEAIALIIIIKVGLSAVSFLYSRRGSVLFACFYGLSGYVMVHTMNPMWLDGVILFPIVILGIENLLHGENILTYAISLSLTLITNFYIGYMTCIFCTLYALYYVFSNGKIHSEEQRKLKLWRFVYTSVLACLSASFVLLPTYNSLGLGKLTYTSPSFIPENKLYLLDFASKMLINSYDTASYSGLPAIYCGVLSLILLPFYFLSDKDSLRRKICSAVLIASLMISMSVTTLDLVWHGFQYPNWMNYRYAYMFIFVILALCSKTLSENEFIQSSTIIKILTVLLFIIAVIQRINYFFLDGISSIWVSILFLIVYGFILCIEKTSRRNTLLLIVVIIELTVNTADSILSINKDVGYSTRTSYTDYIGKYKDEMKKIKMLDDGLYRTVKTDYRTLNDDMSIGMKGITHSSSTMNNNAISVIRNFGYASREHWTKYKGGTIASDSLLGIKYILGGEEIKENKYSLNIIQPVDYKINQSKINYENPFEYQNSIYKALSGTGINVLEKCDVKASWSENIRKDTLNESIHYTSIDRSRNSYIVFDVEVPISGEIYCFFPMEKDQQVNISVNNRFVSSFFDYDNYHVINLGKFNRGEIINVKLTLMSDDIYINKSDYFYVLNYENLEMITNIITKNNCSVKLKNDRAIEGSFTINEDGSVYTSIPYEPGWSIKVDGKKVDYHKFAGGLICFDVQKGMHELSMTYTPPGVITGLIISASAVAAMCLLEKHRKSRLQMSR